MIYIKKRNTFNKINNYYLQHYTRLQSFVRGAKNGLKILLSTIPFFIIAGFLEGFVTRHTEMPDVLAILIIGGSLSLIVFYYIIYPIYLKRNHARSHTL